MTINISKMKDQNRSNLRKIIILSGFFLLISACATVPLTGRSSLQLIPASELLSLSNQQYSKTLSESKLSRDPCLTNMVVRVGNRIARATEQFLVESGRADQIRNYKWDFNVVEDDDVANAWCMPGGKIMVYTGILSYTQNDAGLAVVVGHEVAHAIARHGNERMSQSLVAQLGGLALSTALAQYPSATSQIFTQAFGLTANYGVILPYSRVQEYEADRIGLVLTAKAGYDPREALNFWGRMKAKEGSRTPEFLSTHPAPDSRIAKIKAFMPEAMRYYEKR